MAESDVVLGAAAMAACLQAPVVEARAEPIGGEYGLSGRVFRVRLRLSGNGSRTVVAKLGGADASELHREIAFYRRASDALPLPGPTCLFAGSVAGRPLLLLQDLAPARQGDALAGAGAADVRAVLEGMTPIWSLGPDAAADLPRWGADPAARHRRQERFAEQWRMLRPSVGEQLPAGIRTYGDGLGSRLAAIMAELAAVPPTVLHGDLHLDNVLFPTGIGAPAAAVIDWARTTRGPLAVDVAPFVATSLSQSDRRSVGRQLLAEVADRIRRAGQPAVADSLPATTPAALLVHFAGIIGWLSRHPGTGKREQRLRRAALGDGRLIAALRDSGAESLL